jgi:hypothetical protein
VSTPLDRLPGTRGQIVTLWLAATGLATLAMVAAMVPIGPEWLGVAGAVAVATLYAGGLAARTGGRPIIFGLVALTLGVVTAWAEQDILRTGAAVLTATVAAVLGVMATVPAKGFLGAARECLVAVAIAAVGALATIGFEPAIRVTRFEFTALVLATLVAIVLVFRLGAGFHGLGMRGVVVVLVGVLLLAVTILYAELLRRYGTTTMVDTLLSWVRWSRAELGAFPRPIATILGVPALAYGCHMRARRRQGWWVCAFGVAATSPVTTALANPAITITEATLSVVYSLVVGLMLGWVLIRLDLLLTGPRGRRSRVAEQESAVRPEPARVEPLL